MISGAISALLLLLLPLFGVHLTAAQSAGLVVTVVAIVKGTAFIIAGVIAYKAYKKKEADATSSQPPSS